jgi:hypothetical protein
VSSHVASVFHYTDAAGLLGILGESELWATDQRFLNDAQELIYARDLFVTALAAIENPAVQPGHPAHSDSSAFGEEFQGYKALVHGQLGSPDFPVYVACFCESGDLLSQWRAYGSDHGYAIEFDASSLEEAVEGIDTYPESRGLVQVRYGLEAATDLVATAVRNVNADSNLGHVGVHAHYMALRLTALLAGVKNPGFSEEKEWRLVLGFEYDRAELVQFRSTSRAIIRYIKIPIPRTAILSVRVGPGQHVELRIEGVRRLLRSRSCDAAVLASEVPLRN